MQDGYDNRLRGLLLERADGTSAEMIDAVLAVRPRAPMDWEARLLAIKVFLLSPEAGVLTALNKRIVNILRKAPMLVGVAVNAHALSEPAELALHQALVTSKNSVLQAIAERRYADALQTSTGLNRSVDKFFDQVMVMDDNLERRNNRFALLREVAALLSGVADLSRLPG